MAPRRPDRYQVPNTRLKKIAAERDNLVTHRLERNADSQRFGFGVGRWACPRVAGETGEQHACGRGESQKGEGDKGFLEKVIANSWRK